jgi:hypothetical protein
MSSNVMKGVNSKDAIIGDQLVPFINRSSSEYPVEVGASFFAPVKVEDQKDLSLNVAKEHAKQEYDRIMQMVEILKEQAKQLVSRLDATDLVHGTSFAFHPIHGKEYHIYFNTCHNKNQMGLIGPKAWSGEKPPEHLTFVATVIKKGDSTWEYVDEDSVSN